MAAIEPGDGQLILLTGATGYVGGRLLKQLEGQGYRVRCLTRRPQALAPRVGPQTEIAFGDVLDADTLAQPLQGVHTAYYLVHSMDAPHHFQEAERQAAENFAQAAQAAGVQKIIYVGGLADESKELSPHMQSRLEVGRILRNSGVPTIEFRASIIIGSGSLSFEMIRSLVRKLPVMITPKWVSRICQPIAIEDVLNYLLAALKKDFTTSEVFEIGGADQISYLQLMKVFAKARGLRRLFIPVPLVSPYLSSLWLALFTPLYSRVGRKLIDSIRNDSVVTSSRAQEEFGFPLRGVAAAVERALRYEDSEFAETRWSDALSAGGPQPQFGGVRFGNRLVDARSLKVPQPPEIAFLPIERLGGKTGWYYGNWLWKLRGLMDLMVGGVGLRRGRRDPNHLVAGDTLDFWRVEAVEPGRLLRLYAEMKVPGRAWLQFEITPESDGGSTIHQTAIFDPYGLFGQAYWYAVYPLHGFIFAGMLNGIARQAQHLDEHHQPEPLAGPQP